jgi:N-acetyldiaminopimelate deacetylase
MNLVEVRHKLHMMPEIAFREFKTQAYIKELLTNLSISYEEVAGTGILARWESGDGPYILFRADMDALPVREETGCEFSSRNEGFMHACGHDIHMSVLLGLVERVSIYRPHVNILFLFQPAEAAGGGAELCLKTLENYPIEEVWALHVTDEYPEGTVNTRPGVLFASAYEIDSTFEGRSAHVAFFKQGRDAVEGAMEFLRRIYESDTGEYVLRFGLIEGGRVRNVVPDSCTLYGTIRAVDVSITERVVAEIEKLGKLVADERELRYLQKVGSRYPQLVVNGDLYKKLCRLVDVNEVEMKYTGEDFAFLALRYPGLMFWLGTGREERVGLHNSKFLPSDSVIEKGVEVFWKVITDRTLSL